ncbi:MAG: hypothetical protein WAN11_00125 [Syntrophobacteraceae bacterium]
MSPTPVHNPPIRITDIIELKRIAANITCSPVIEVIPVDFTHRTGRFQALVFICWFSGTVDGQQYTFRKCYARGCTHNGCPRVSQAVMIANRYLQRDYHRLERGGIRIDKKLFTLEASVVRLMDLQENPKAPMVIDDCIEMAKGGIKVSVNVALEYVPATEHFEYGKNSQTFLLADFTVTTPGESATCLRCLGCYPTEREREERQVQMQVANDRLSLLYKKFDLSSVEYNKAFFGVNESSNKIREELVLV